MKTAAFVQARLGSSRLPLKSLINLHGQPIVDWVRQRIGQARLIDEIVFAIPDTPLDTVLRDHLRKQEATVFCGPENDVLERFYLAAEKHKPDLVVRVCADNPLVSGQALDELVEFYLKSGADYVYNHIPRNNLWPDGLGAEILSFDLLRHLRETAKEPHQREHCLSYIWDNKEEFKIATFDPADPRLHRPDLKLDIDTVEDYYRLARLPLRQDMTALEVVTACSNQTNQEVRHVSQC